MFRRQTVLEAAAFIVLISLGGQAQASLIITWDFAGLAGDADIVTGDVTGGDGLVSAADFTFTGLVNSTSAGSDFFTTSNWPAFPSELDDRLLQFGLTVATGNTYDISNISFQSFSSTSGGGNSFGPEDLAIFFNTVDDFSTSTALLNFTQLDDDTTTVDLATDLADLSAVSGLTGTTYFWIGATSTDASGIGGINSTTGLFSLGPQLVLEGTVTAVPEPSAVVVLSVAILIVAFWKLGPLLRERKLVLRNREVSLAIE